MMVIGSFTPKDKITTPGSIKKDKEALRYSSGFRFLDIYPSFGFIHYHNEIPLGTREGPIKGQLEALTGVPNEEETTRLGLKYIRMLGVEISQLAVKPGTGDLDLHWYRGTRSHTDASGEDVTETNEYGVSFSRRIDGISVEPLGTRGGVFISFGNHAQIIDLQVCWRNFEAYEFSDCPSPKQIGEWLTDGRVSALNTGNMVPYRVQPDQHLKITKVQFFYNGVPGDRPMDFCFPFATVEGVAEGKSGTNGFWFRCPMTMSKDNWKVIR
jgi:hypothetical protein